MKCSKSEVSAHSEVGKHGAKLFARARIGRDHGCIKHGNSVYVAVEMCSR